MATMLNAESNFTRPNQIQACTNSVLSSKQSRQYTKDCTNKNNVVNRKKNLYKLLKQVPHTHTFLTKTIHEKKREIIIMQRKHLAQQRSAEHVYFKRVCVCVPVCIRKNKMKMYNESCEACMPH